MFAPPNFSGNTNLRRTSRPILVRTFITRTTIRKLSMHVLIQLTKLSRTRHSTTHVHPARRNLTTRLLTIINTSRLKRTTARHRAIRSPHRRRTKGHALRLSHRHLINNIISSHRTLRRTPLNNTVRRRIRQPRLINYKQPRRQLSLNGQRLLTLTSPRLRLYLLVRPLRTLVIRIRPHLAGFRISRPSTVTLIPLHRYRSPHARLSVTIKP